MFKQKSDTAPAADPVQQARTRARQRLVGAVVLLVVGVIGFPLVFETQPRPIPVDIPIEIPKRDAMPSLAQPSSPTPAVAPAATLTPPSRAVAAAPSRQGRGEEEIITESREDAGREVPAPRPAASSGERPVPASTPARPAASASIRVAASAPAKPGSAPSRVAVSASAMPAAAASDPRRVAAAASTAVPAPRPTASAPTRSDADGERARALLEGRSPGSAADGARFVVQVGAFADAEAARETRLKVEKLGMKTYTQVAQTSGGSRIRVRVGPFTSRADADAALAKAKAAGLTAVVLTL